MIFSNFKYYYNKILVNFRNMKYYILSLVCPSAYIILLYVLFVFGAPRSQSIAGEPRGDNLKPLLNSIIRVPI